jgi:malate:Na+ symporter
VATTLVLIVVALALAGIGRRLPRIRTLGLDTVIVIFVPSYLVYIDWIPLATLSQAKRLFDATHVIELFIAIVISGSILSIDRRGLIAGLGKILLPLCAGSIAAATVGTLVGTVLGLKSTDAFFRVVAPMMGGGLTAGALPLSIGYARYIGTTQGDALALMLPAVILGNLAAIVLSGLVGFIGQNRIPKHPKLVWEFRQPMSTPDEVPSALVEGNTPCGKVCMLAVAAVIIFGIYFAGFLAARTFGWPAPLVVLAVSVALQLTNILPSSLRSGALTFYRFCIATFTYPLLFAVGLLQTPWGKLIDGFSLVNLATVFAVVLTLAGSGYFISSWCRLNPVDGAILTVTRAAMGGTGDVAILSAARRFELMPFAQITTRIGGAATVAMALAVMQSS